MVMFSKVSTLGAAVRVNEDTGEIFAVLKLGEHIISSWSLPEEDQKWLRKARYQGFGFVDVTVVEFAEEFVAKKLRPLFQN